MLQAQKRQQGFSAVEVLVVVLVVALVGLIGFVGYNKIHNKTPNSAAKTSNTSTPTPTTPSKPAVAVTEWGIKIEFDDADKVTYRLSTDNDGKQYAQLYLKDSVTTVENCKALGVGFSRDINTTSTKVGDHYYQLGGAPGACDDPNGVNGTINQLRVKIDTDQLGANKYTLSAAE